MNQRIPEFLVCPCCRGRLLARTTEEGSGALEELVCPACGLGFAVLDHIPMMVPHDARTLPEAEAEAWRLKAKRLSGAAPRPNDEGSIQ